MAEIRHAHGVINGYAQRHGAMIAAQAEFDRNYPEQAKQRESHEFDYHPARLAVSPALAARLTRELLTAAERLISRCLKDSLIDIVVADDLRAIFARPTETEK
jgi:hypothetical protein